MNRREFVKNSTLSALGASFFSSLPHCSVFHSTPPNVVLIVVDDLGWADTGCYGNTYHETPNIDQLAKEGIRFTDGYASCAVCSPTRAALMTGRYPTRHGITTWINPWLDEKEKNNLPGYVNDKRFPLATPRNHAYMESSEKTIAEYLKEQGYATCHIGKWHLGGSPHLPQDQGFDINMGGCDFGQPKGGSYFDPYEIPFLEDKNNEEYLTDREAKEAVNFIKKAHSNNKPFFLYLPHYAVHTPIQAKEDLTERYREKEIPPNRSFHPQYAAMVQSVDDAVGKISRTLKELNMEENTIVIFTSDNGGLKLPWGEKGANIWTDNAPLRAGKGFPYEGGIREPYIFKWKGKIPENRVSHELIGSIDILPTVLGLVGGPADSTQKIDGIDFSKHLKGGEKIGHEALFWHFPHYWAGGTVAPYSAVRLKEWKLIRFYETGRYELYNLEQDIGETKNLYDTFPGKAEELNRLLDQWLKETGAKFPKPNENYQPSNIKTKGQ